MSCDDATQIIVDHVYNKDPLSMGSVVFAQLLILFEIRHVEHESYRHFEDHFSAVSSQFNSLGSSVSLSDPMATLLLMANANVGDSYYTAIFAGAATKGMNPRFARQLNT